MSSPFTSFLAQHFGQINDYLATFFDGQRPLWSDTYRALPVYPASTFTATMPCKAPPLRASIRDACRHRAVGGSFESARSAAAAIESISSRARASIHDDIADND